MTDRSPKFTERLKRNTATEDCCVIEGWIPGNRDLIAKSNRKTHAFVYWNSSNQHTRRKQNPGLAFVFAVRPVPTQNPKPDLLMGHLAEDGDYREVGDGGSWQRIDVPADRATHVSISRNVSEGLAKCPTCPASQAIFFPHFTLRQFCYRLSRSSSGWILSAIS
jgi:hypothetical protein